MLNMGDSSTKKMKKNTSSMADEEEEELEIPAPTTLPTKKKVVPTTPSPAKTPAMNWWKHLDDADASATSASAEKVGTTKAEV
jgi:hypothetical protein